jgi:hypothetical protein
MVSDVETFKCWKVNANSSAQNWQQQLPANLPHLVHRLQSLPPTRASSIRHWVRLPPRRRMAYSPRAAPSQAGHGRTPAKPPTMSDAGPTRARTMLPNNDHRCRPSCRWTSEWV